MKSFPSADYPYHFPALLRTRTEGVQAEERSFRIYMGR